MRVRTQEEEEVSCTKAAPTARTHVHLHATRHTTQLYAALIGASQYAERASLPPQVVPRVHTCPVWDPSIHPPSDHLHGMTPEKVPCWIRSNHVKRQVVKNR
jgi:hypothetical protein